MQTKELITYCNTLLAINEFQDYCLNGLQVEGKAEVKKLITGVTACQRLLDEAVKLKADMLLVHHGYFWKGEEPSITGIKKKRLKTLLEHDINLAAYHLPLDAHAKLGNNVLLAQKLGLHVSEKLAVAGNPDVLYLAEFSEAKSVKELSALINHQLQREPLAEISHDRKIKKVGLCTGAAQDFIELAAEQGCDAFITGEVSERTIHSAREYGINFFACGHHATERYGIQALGEHLAAKFNVQQQFVDIDNPV